MSWGLARKVPPCDLIVKQLNSSPIKVRTSLYTALNALFSLCCQVAASFAASRPLHHTTTIAARITTVYEAYCHIHWRKGCPSFANDRSVDAFVDRVAKSLVGLLPRFVQLRCSLPTLLKTYH